MYIGERTGRYQFYLWVKILRGSKEESLLLGYMEEEGGDSVFCSLSSRREACLATCYGVSEEAVERAGFSWGLRIWEQRHVIEKHV